MAPRQQGGPFVIFSLISQSGVIEYENSCTYSPPESVSFSGINALKDLRHLLDEVFVEIGKLEVEAKIDT